MARLTKATFTANGTWVCPAGITQVFVYGFGGGGGGGSNKNSSDAFGGGGGGSIAQTALVAVTPGTSYTVQIGTGGSGAPSNTSGVGANGNQGNSTVFGNSYSR